MLQSEQGHSSAVQRCLDNNEIIRNVVRYVAQDGRGDVVSLSTTARSFHDAAQDAIWKNLVTLGDLLKCFPKGVWSPSQYDPKMLQLERPAAPDEWDRFLANAGRVKAFAFARSLYSMSDIQWWQMLAVHRPVLDIFPNIRRLEWHDDDPELLAFAHLFIASGLRSLVLKYEGDEGYEGLASVISSVVHRRCPLREFRLHLREDSYVEEIDAAVADLVYTADLKLYNSNADIRYHTVQHLLHSRTIKTLQFPTAEISYDMISDAESLPSSVEILHLGVYDLWTCLVLALHVAPHTLTDLTVTRRRDPTRESAHRFFEALSKRSDPRRLKKLVLLPHESLYITSNRQHFLHPDRYDLNSVLEPLFALSNLTHLRITSVHLDVDDCLINTFIQKFPCLESLLLLPGYYHKRLFKATLHSVRHATSALPSLHTLGYPVDTSIDLSPHVEHLGQVNSTCSLLDFADSPLSPDNVDMVAVFLGSFLKHPDLQITVFSCDESGDKRYLHEIGAMRQRRLWRMVRTAMRPNRALPIGHI